VTNVPIGSVRLTEPKRKKTLGLELAVAKILKLPYDVITDVAVLLK